MAKSDTGAGVTFTYVQPSQLRFDPTNPRFAAAGSASEQDDIQQLLERGGRTFDDFAGRDLADQQFGQDADAAHFRII